MTYRSPAASFIRAAPSVAPDTSGNDRARVISVASNLIPAQIKALTKFAAAGNYAEGAMLHTKVFPLIKSLFIDGNPVGIKYAMKVAGMDSGELRLPLWEASESTKKLIEGLVGKLGIANRV